MAAIGCCVGFWLLVPHGVGLGHRFIYHPVVLGPRFDSAACPLSVRIRTAEWAGHSIQRVHARLGSLGIALRGRALGPSSPRWQSHWSRNR
eukprot:541800-Pyramimonas_sp.AAC.1